MGHCGGGPTTDQFDVLTPLVQWVENGVAPGPVVASGSNFAPGSAGYGAVNPADVPGAAGPATRSRPLRAMTATPARENPTTAKGRWSSPAFPAA